MAVLAELQKACRSLVRLNSERCLSEARIRVPFFTRSTRLVFELPSELKLVCILLHLRPAGPFLPSSKSCSCPLFLANVSHYGHYTQLRLFSANMVKSLTLVGCLFATLIGHSAGHFLMLYPPSIGFDDALEATPPCGSFTVDFSKDNVTDFHVGGDVLAMVRQHYPMK
jgi:hypothetical protein